MNNKQIQSEIEVQRARAQSKQAAAVALGDEVKGLRQAAADELAPDLERVTQLEAELRPLHEKIKARKEKLSADIEAKRAQRNQAARDHVASIREMQALEKSLKPRGND